MNPQLLIAETGIWAHPEVHRRLLAQGTPARFPNCRRFRRSNGERRGDRIGNLILDDNSYANIAMKQAIGIPRQHIVGFETCHIWPESCYDEHYHTAVSNLVLLPRSLAGLTDHNPDIQLALQYRAFELYRWHPADQAQPVKPAGYPTNWRDPMPVSHFVLSVDAKIQTGHSDIAPRANSFYRRDYAKFDAIIGGQSFHAMTMRFTALRLIKGLVNWGVTPNQIYAVLPTRGRRLFASADGHLDLKAFIDKMNSDRKRVGKTFDSARYLCQNDQLMSLEGRTFALTNQWGDGTEETIKALLQAFPESGIVVNRCGSLKSKTAAT
jgi:hypothetical protein